MKSSLEIGLLNAAGLPADFLEPVFDCPDCRDTGYVDGKKCHCFRQAEIELLYQQSKLKDVLEKENFDTLSYDFFEGEQLAAFQTAVNKCRDFARSFSRLGSNLFFYGTVGTGKTFLSNCIARESIESGHSVIYFSASSLFDTLSRNAFDYKNQESLDYLYNDLYNCDLLVIDDLGTEQSLSLIHIFRRFAQLLPEDGVLIINGDIPDYREITEGLACSVITFGSLETCDYYPTDISHDELAHAGFTLNRRNGSPVPVSLGVPGEHNILNALAALALADYLQLDMGTASRALKNFTGTDRRFEYKGSLDGITIVDDYAHHPTEITATLKAAVNYPHKTLWCVFQPHTYTRTKAFLSDFADALSLADKVILADIYAARETDTLGISSRDLQEEIGKKGTECHYFPSFEEIQNFILENCTAGDLLITMGAGDVVNIGENLLKR